MDITFFLGVVLILPFMIEVSVANCSCYTFHEDGLTWTAARQSCQFYGGDLVSMETGHEWLVVKDHIQNLTNLFNDDWHIGLRINNTVVGNWTWVSGKPLTIDRWQPWQPRDGAPYVVMAKNYPPGTKGLFNDVRGDIFAGFICEKRAECSRAGLICKNPEEIKNYQGTTISRTRSIPTPTTLRRNHFTTERTTPAGKTDTLIMVEKVQPPSGFIHWTVAVIPLACVIAVLVCVIGFLVWRLKMRTRKQNGDITVNAVHYNPQTRSIHSPEGRANNLRGVNQMRVHFKDSNSHEDPKYHTIQQGTNNENNCVQYAALYKTPGEFPAIPRRSAIRRKNSSELKGKYPLNKTTHQDHESAQDYTGSEIDSFDQNNEKDRTSRAYQVLASDYDEPHSIIVADQENTENQDCSDDELSYLEIIP